MDFTSQKASTIDTEIKRIADDLTYYEQNPSANMRGLQLRAEKIVEQLLPTIQSLYFGVENQPEFFENLKGMYVEIREAGLQENPRPYARRFSDWAKNYSRN